ncbi:hypothetical protein HPB47_023681 [Ixodes persulcatus]|uniref:Uncharacterized protein n=1 Tax=Ixodes persulcatus TaxID=34615 RepID=A0AC60Q8J0_IXOPE|nr:hypothetical protein HPB47_023681 [Ixodes persulcatus]
MWTQVKVLGLLAVVLLAANLTVALGNATEATKDSIMPTEDPEIVEMEEGFKRLTEDITRFAAKQFLPIVSEIIYDPRLSGECAGGLLKIGTALRDGEGWVLAMLDSMGRPPPGMMSGRLAEYGAYEQCLDIRHPRNQFQGKYCMIQVNGNGKITPTLYKMADQYLEHLNFKYVGNISKVLEVKELLSLGPLFKIGSCIPSVCRKEDLQFILDTVLDRYKIKLNVGWCQVQEPVVYDQRQIAIISIFGVWLSFLFLGTAFDLYQSWAATDDREYSTKPQRQGIVSTILLAFSLRRGLLKLIQMPQFGDYSNDLGFIHGMRVLSATWVVLGHSYIIRDQQSNSDFTVFLKRVQKDIFFSVQMNSFLAVGSFFAITGFLSGYIILKTSVPKVSTYILIIVGLVRRYIRLIPSMMALIGFVYLVPLIASGPLLYDMWPVFERPCTVHWWKILTMTQNYMDDFTDMCMPHFWYVSVDFQLAIFSTIILVAIVPRWPKVGIALMAAIVISTTIAVGVVTHLHNYMPMSLVLSTNIKALIETGMYVYNKAFCHASALFTGIIFGCLAAKPHQLSRKAQAFWWTVATVSACASLFGIYSWNRGRAPEHLESVIYAAMHRFAWAFGVSWVMYACATGRGGPVNKILANPLLYPLGRLSFAVYLVHAIVLGVNGILSRERKSHQPFLQAQDYISVTITSYAFATITYLCIECPIAVLDNLVFGGVKPKKDLSLEAPKQNGTHELKSVHIANGVASNGALSKPINGIPTSVTSHGDSLHSEEYKNQHNAHENAAYEREFGVKITNNNDETVTVQF